MFEALLAEARQTVTPSQRPSATDAEALVTATNALLPYSLSAARAGPSHGARAPRRCRRRPAGARGPTTPSASASALPPPALAPKEPLMKRFAFAVALALACALRWRTRSSTRRRRPAGPDGRRRDPHARRRLAGRRRSSAATCSPTRQGSGAQATARALEEGTIRPITSAKEFADTLTRHLRAVTHDLHLRVHYRHEPLPVGGRRRADAGRSAPPLVAAGAAAATSASTRCSGCRATSATSSCAASTARRGAARPRMAAMQFLGNTDALIFDLRRNGGGDPNMIVLLLTYLVEPGRARARSTTSTSAVRRAT